MQLQKQNRIFFVIPYCSGFARARINSEVRKIELMLQHDMKSIFRIPPTIRVSWKNYMPNIDSVLGGVALEVLGVGRREKKHLTTIKKLGELKDL